ncbi:MAG TPA: hypothetical protein DEA71_15330, partial [Nitrospira sp.]|nr:hypothetical protein [Nitrospira sp.]
MKPLFSGMKSILTARPLLMPCGLAFAGWIAAGEMPALADEMNGVKPKEMTPVESPSMRYLAQTLTSIEVRPESDLVTI